MVAAVAAMHPQQDCGKIARLQDDASLPVGAVPKDTEDKQ